VLFSWSEGTSWYSIDLSNQPVDVDNIVTEPSEKSMNFMVLGTRQGSGVIFHLDFEALDQPKCKGSFSPDSVASDYETWTPSDANFNKCLLGRKLVYTRRKPTSECFNGDDFKRPVESSNCECTQENFECEVGFTRDIEAAITEGTSNAAKQCHPATDGGIDFSNCNAGERFLLDGYRKIPGDKCVGGWTPTKVEVVCPAGRYSAKAKTSLNILVLIAIAMALAAFVMRNDKFGFVWPFQIDTFKTTMYQNLDTAASGFGVPPVSAIDDVGARYDETDFIDEEDGFEETPRLLCYETSEPVEAPRSMRGDVVRAAAYVPTLQKPGGKEMDDAIDLL